MSEVRTAERRLSRRVVLGVAAGTLPALFGLAQSTAAQSGAGTITGRVVDDTTGRGLPGATVIVGYETQQLATTTTSDGRYAFTSVAPGQQLDVIAFLPGYTYLLLNQNLAPGQSVTLDFHIIPEPNPTLIPTIEAAMISTISVEPGQSVTFAMTVRPGSEVPLSPEVLVTNPTIGRMVLLAPAGGDDWRATWTAPASLPEGVYDWTFVAVDQACREPSTFPVRALAVTAPRLFPATNLTAPGIFAYAWRTRGAERLNGWPITEARREINRDDGQTYLVQYFERNRFEYHPERGGTPDEVQFGLIGRQVTRGREQEPPFLPVPPPPDTAAQRFFAPTGHTLGSAAGFRAFWEQYGGLAQFGYPISEEFTENGLTVQYFERARFEHHPTNPPEYQVLLGALGRELLAGR